ncbi:MAG: ATP-binding protein [Lachnospiraceae bacterium]|nr:ATP-binding protein [Lachnospiraceae bacterium]
MKRILILSGKGGTGKTTAAAAFIRFAHARAIADCDVDAPNLHIVTSMQTAPKRSDFLGSQKAQINQKQCIQCGLCMQNCRFDAIRKREDDYYIEDYACEGCGVCSCICPEQAVTMQTDIAGELSLYQEDTVFSTAALKMGRGNSGKLVTEVKLAMLKAAPETDLAIIDGSPGIGCPVIASISGMDLVLIVTEPTLSGLSDLERLLKTTATFQTKTAVCINKWDTSPENAALIEQFCAENSIPFAGKIPYDRNASAAVNAGRSIADIDCPARDALFEVFQNTIRELKL